MQRNDDDVYVLQSRYTWVKPVMFILVALNVTLGLLLYFSAPVVSNRRPVVAEIGKVQVSSTATPGPAATPYGDVRGFRIEPIITWQRTISRLETKEFEIISDAPKTRIGGMFGIGGESIQAHLVGTVIGRVDLDKLTINPNMTDGDIIISKDGQSVSVVLPYPEITRPLLDEGQSSFNNHTIGWFTSSDPNLWQAAHAEAAKMLVEKACENGIGEKARIEAEAQITSIFGISFKHVFVRTRPATKQCGT